MGRGGYSEEPDEGKLHARFCEGAHSNLGAKNAAGGAVIELYSILHESNSFDSPKRVHSCLVQAPEPSQQSYKCKKVYVITLLMIAL